jgi:hypothetical protein
MIADTVNEVNSRWKHVASLAVVPYIGPRVKRVRVQTPGCHYPQTLTAGEARDLARLLTEAADVIEGC